MVEVNCENCGKLVHRHPAHFNHAKHHYCSRDCRTEHRRKNNIKNDCANPSSAYRKIVALAEMRKSMLQ